MYLKWDFKRIGSVTAEIEKYSNNRKINKSFHVEVKEFSFPRGF